ncbi:MAG: glycyl radical protein [Peptococcaceae bacterium]|nr:glycyl radical protein [Peptococcaceae bacterium]
MTQPIQCCYSPHEQHIMDANAGSTDYKKGRERIYKILDRNQNLKPVIDAERAKYFTESMAQTEGEHLTLRWAKALMHIAKNITVYVEEDSLLAGRIGCQGRYGILYPELDGDIFEEAIKLLPTRVTSPFNMTQETVDTILNDIAPYWDVNTGRGKTFFNDLYDALPADTLAVTYEPEFKSTSRFIVNETASFRSSNQWVPDFEKVLKRGFKGLKEEALEKLAALDNYDPLDNVNKKPFYEAIVIVCDAIVLWANRYADLYEVEAEKETDPVRKQEMVDIAARCRWVPENPARDFREAIQSQWFTQMFSRLEQKTGTIVSNGRMDQYLYPYYKADKEAGKLTDEQAMEMLECMWVGMAQFIDLYMSVTGGAFNEGYAHWEAVTIGGQTPDGQDATNELTYLFLKSKQEFPLHYPDLAARVHARSPQRYIEECAKTIKEGSGFPKLLNDEEIVLQLVSNGAKIHEAFDYAVSGCAEARMPNRDTFTSGGVYINFASAIEMMMYNGRTFKTGDELLGIETGDVETFETWDDVWNAYVIQAKNLLRHAFIQQKNINRLREKHFAAPMLSAMHDLCMENALDLHTEFIPGGVDIGYFESMGFGTVVDSLAAIKKLVFDEKVTTLVEIREAMKANFEGYEVLKQRLLNAPKYGNNDPYADEIGKACDLVCSEFTDKYSKSLGIEYCLRYVPFTSHVPFGKVVGATPNGRVAYFPLSDGSSASHGCDTNGPTAVMLSNYFTKNPGFHDRAARLLNIKFDPSTVAGEDGTKKLASFIRTWCDLKLWHVQFNVINKETLIAAKENPDRYRGLIVRIAGYSAYFCDLSPALQDDLIARTQQTTI